MFVTFSGMMILAKAEQFSNVSFAIVLRELLRVTLVRVPHPENPLWLMLVTEFGMLTLVNLRQS